MIERFSAFFIFCILASGAVTAVRASGGQTEYDSLTAKTDMLFAEWDRTISPGCALAVIKDGKIIYKRGYGMANLEHGIPISSTSVFRIASLSKQFTAACIALLAEGGKLSLDDDIRKYLPEMPEYESTITIRHLIHHTSGIRDYIDLMLLAGMRLDHHLGDTDLIGLLSRQKELNFAPGDEYLYCNSGYFLLSVIVKRVSGQSLRKFAEENIFGPLGMEQTHYHDDHTMIVRERAAGYSPRKEGGYYIDMTTLEVVGDGSMLTTVEDLFLWDQNFYNSRLGGADFIEQLLTPGVFNSGEKQDYASGLFIGEYKGLKIVRHEGAFVGYRTAMIRFPEQKFSVICLANLSNIEPEILLKKVADIYLANEFVEEKPVNESTKHTPIAVDPAIYDSYIGRYQIMPGLLINIAEENGKLMGKLQDHPKTELIAESETRFVLSSADMDISFQRDENDQVTHLITHRNGREIHARRIKNLSLSQDQMEEFVGNYYSDELGTACTLIIRDGNLVARPRHHNDVILEPIGVDEFSGNSWWFRHFHFSRDSDQEILGFRMASRRVKNLYFAKR